MTVNKIAACLLIVAAATLPAACGKRGAPSRPGAETSTPLPEVVRPTQSTTPEQDNPVPPPRTTTTP